MDQDATAALRRLADEYLDRMARFHPSRAQLLGLHQYEGRVPDLGPDAVRARVAELRDQQRRLAAIPRTGLAPDDEQDHRLLEAAIGYELFEWEDLRDHERNPIAYLDPTDLSGYVKRAYAPLPERVRRLTAHAAGIPALLAQARASLRPPFARPHVETAIDMFRGTIDYFEGELGDAVRVVDDPALLAAFGEAVGSAVEALRSFVGWLQEELPRASGDFAIGERRYRQMLRLGELVDLPLDRVLEVGRRDLAANQEQLRDTLARIGPGRSPAEVLEELAHRHPTADRLVPAAAAMLAEIRRFLVERRIVSVPSDDLPRVEPTPPFLRWGFAFMDPPGAFEEVATEAYYYVTPVEPHWTPELQEQWLRRFDDATLQATSIHEAFPGHYVQFLHQRHARTPLAKALWSYAFVEGWAHYCEEMLLDAGFGAGDLALRAAQLREALLRDGRYVVSIEMHAGEMGLDEATRFLVENAHLGELPARKEAVRGTFDPGYLNYTLGKLQIKRLRADAEARQGSAFSLQTFHDAVLAHGAPPIAILRWRLLGDPVEARL